MLRLLLLILIVAPVYGPCSKKRPRPQPIPQPTVLPTPEPTATPTPDVSPTPIVRATPTPYPLPPADPKPFLRSQGGTVKEVVIQPGDDVGKLVVEADALLSGPGKLVIRGGGSVKTAIVHVTNGVPVAGLKHDTEWHGEYTLDTETIWSGAVMLGPNTTHDLTNAVFYEPTYFFQGEGFRLPAITCFQVFDAHEGKPENVTIIRPKIRGRQANTDGGVRQTISMGNCHNCAVLEPDLEGIASIGVQFGGSARLGNHATNVLLYGGRFRSFAAAAVALVNVDGARVTGSGPDKPLDIARPGRRPGEPGGISGIDIETNGFDDCARNIVIDNFVIGYGSGGFLHAGNGVLAQNVYNTPCAGGLVIANGVIDGWEGVNDNNVWALSNGLFIVGRWPGGVIANVRVLRATQSGVQAHGMTGMTIQDSWFMNVGGGGLVGWQILGSTGNTFLRNRIFDDPRIPGSTHTGIGGDHKSRDNVFANLEDGGVAFLPDPKASPSPSP